MLSSLWQYLTELANNWFNYIKKNILNWFSWTITLSLLYSALQACWVDEKVLMFQWMSTAFVLFFFNVILWVKQAFK